MKLWVYVIVFFIYQIGISFYYLGYLLYAILFLKINRSPANLKTGWSLSQELFFQQSGTDEIEFNSTPLIWIHAVSGGEVKLAGKIIKEFYPNSVFQGKVLITYCSSTGKEVAEKLKTEVPYIFTSYLPIDFYFLTRYWLFQIRRNYQLKKFIVIEHDFWPNWLSAVKKTKADRIAVNYFLKTRDYRYYRFFPPSFHLVHNLDVVFTQNSKTTEQVMDFHPSFKVITAGNMKYSHSTSFVKMSTPTNRKRASSLSAPIFPKGITITLGSSHSGEEELLLNILKKFFIKKPSKGTKEKQPPYSIKKKSSTTPIQLIIIPRHPYRCKEIGDLITQKYGLDFEFFNPKVKIYKKNILLVNQMGWSEFIYYYSHIVIIGDTFIPSQGGHNFLEPIVYSKCVIYGPYMVNYSDITPLFEKEKGVIRVSSGNINENLENIIENLINHKRKTIQIGKTGYNLFKKISYDRKAYQRILTV